MAEPGDFETDADEWSSKLLASPLAGKEEWNIEGMAPDSDLAQSRIGDFLKTHAQADRSWEDTSAHFQQRFPGLNPEPLKEHYQQLPKMLKLEQARQKEEQKPYGAADIIASKSMPVASTFGNVYDQIHHARALQRIQAGQPLPDDYETVARVERAGREQEAMGKTWSGSVGMAAAHLPAIIGEFALGGAALRGGAAAAPKVLGWLAPKATEAGLGLGARAGLGVARTAALTPLVPSMYAERAVQNNIQAGRDPTDVRGLPSAYALAVLQLSVFQATGGVGSKLFPQSGIGPAAARIGTAGAVGGFGSGPVADVLGYAAGLDNRYGPIQDLVEGKAGDALRHATVNALTFAAFAGMHEGQHGSPESQQAPEYAAWRSRQMMQDFNKFLGNAKAKGMSADAAGKATNDLFDQVAQAMAADPKLTVADAAAKASEGAKGPVKDLAESLATQKPPEAATGQPSPAEAQAAEAEMAPHSGLTMERPSGEKQTLVPPTKPGEQGEGWRHSGTKFTPTETGAEFEAKGGKYTVSHKEYDDGDVRVGVKNAEGQEVGRVLFNRKADGSYVASKLLVDEAARKTGMARAMYDYILDQGGQVKPSKFLSKEAKNLWAKNQPPKGEPANFEEKVQELMGKGIRRDRAEMIAEASFPREQPAAAEPTGQPGKPTSDLDVVTEGLGRGPAVQEVPAQEGATPEGHLASVARLENAKRSERAAKQWAEAQQIGGNREQANQAWQEAIAGRRNAEGDLKKIEADLERQRAEGNPIHQATMAAQARGEAYHVPPAGPQPGIEPPSNLPEPSVLDAVQRSIEAKPDWYKEHGLTDLQAKIIGGYMEGKGPAEMAKDLEIMAHFKAQGLKANRANVFNHGQAGWAKMGRTGTAWQEILAEHITGRAEQGEAVDPEDFAGGDLRAVSRKGSQRDRVLADGEALLEQMLPHTKEGSPLRDKVGEIFERFSQAHEDYERSKNLGKYIRELRAASAALKEAVGTAPQAPPGIPPETPERAAIEPPPVRPSGATGLPEGGEPGGPPGAEQGPGGEAAPAHIEGEAAPGGRTEAAGDLVGNSGLRVHEHPKQRGAYIFTREGKKVGHFEIGESKEATAAARKAFPELMKGKTAARISSIWVEPAERQQKLGQLFYLHGLDKAGADWLFNEDNTPAATNALLALERKGLVDLHWKSQAPQANEAGGPHLVRATPAGREALQEGNVRPASEIDAQARQIRDDHNASIVPHNEYLAEARKALGGKGKLLHLERYQDADSVPGLDEVAKDMNVTDAKLFADLKKGNLQPMTLAEARQQAQEGQPMAPRTEAPTAKGEAFEGPGDNPGNPEEIEPGVAFTGLPIPKATADWLAEKVQSVRDGVAELAGQMGPRTTRASQPAGEALARYNAAPGFAREAAPLYIDKVLGRDATDAQRKSAGAIITERRLRHIREVYMQQARDASAKAAEARDAMTKGTPEERTAAASFARRYSAEATEAMHNAREVQTIVGKPNSPLATDADYQAGLTSPFMRDVFHRWKDHFVPVMEDNFRRAEGMEDTDPIRSQTQIPGEPVNLKAVQEGEADTGSVVITNPSRGNLKNVRLGKLPFARQATGAADGYDIDLGSIIENSLKRGTSLAAKAELMRTLVKEGLAAWDKPGQRVQVGEQSAREIPEVKPPRGTQQAEAGQTSLYVDPRVYGELRQALAVDEPARFPTLAAVNSVLTRAALASTIEAAYHSKNLLTFMLKPGVRVTDFFKNTYNVLAKDPGTAERLVELARIGALKTEGSFESGGQYARMNPLRWMGDFLDLLQRGMRLTAEDAFERLHKSGRAEGSETNKRDFINQLGQYNVRAQNKMVALLRDTGLGPFATAGTNYWMQGWRALTMNPGVKATGTGADLGLRAEMLGKTVAVLGAAALANYLMHRNVFGDDKTPLGAIKTGQTGNKTHYFDLTNLIGLTRGMRQTGLLALAEGARSGESQARTTDKAVESIVHGLLHPAVGPPVQFAYTAATGRNTMGMKVAAEPEPGQSHAWQNFRAAIANANPAYAMLSGANRPGQEVPMSERLWQLAGPYGQKTTERQAALVADYYDMREALHHSRPVYTQKGQAYPHERQYRILESVHQRMVEYGKALKAPGLTPERAGQLRQAQVELARRAMDAAR